MKQPEQIELSANSHQKTIFATVIEVSLGKRMPGGDPTIMFCFIIIMLSYCYHLSFVCFFFLRFGYFCYLVSFSYHLFFIFHLTIIFHQYIIISVFFLLLHLNILFLSLFCMHVCTGRGGGVDAPVFHPHYFFSLKFCSLQFLILFILS